MNIILRILKCIEHGMLAREPYTFDIKYGNDEFTCTIIVYDAKCCVAPVHIIIG